VKREIIIIQAHYYDQREVENFKFEYVQLDMTNREITTSRGFLVKALSLVSKFNRKYGYSNRVLINRSHLSRAHVDVDNVLSKQLLHKQKL